MSKEHDKQHSGMCRFLSVLLRDEPTQQIVAAMADPAFADSFGTALKEAGNANWIQTATLLEEAFADTGPENVYRQLRFEYADMFLGVGVDPVFPYESVHLTGLPLVRQKNVFELRALYREAGVRPNPQYADLEEHIAVELEFLAHCLENELDAGAEGILGRLQEWGPKFFDHLYQRAESPFYRAAAKLGLGYLALADEGASLPGALADSLAMLPLGDGLTTLAGGATPPLPDTAIPTHCYTCGALCGMTAKLSDGVLTGTVGLPGDPKGAGKLCPKGGSAPKHVYSAYRLKAPLVKEDGRFRKAGWDEALDRMADGIRSIPEGKLAYFRGNDFCNWIHEALFGALGCPKGTHRTMCDNSNRMWNEHTQNDKRPWINYEGSDYILHFGMNELATSYGQRKTAGLKNALKNGAKLVVFDPRKSETAAKASEWIPLKPATDGAVAMAMAWVIVTENLYDRTFVAKWTEGFDRFKARLLGEEDGVARTPEWAEAISDVPAETIARIAREFAGAKAKGAISWTGLAQNPNGHWSTGAVQSLNTLCGTHDAPGGPGLIFKRKLSSAWGEGQAKPEAKSAPKVDNFGLWSGWSPARLQANVEEGKIEGMVMYWGDPALTAGNSEAETKGIEAMRFAGGIEAFMCDSALLFDVLLPDATWLEQAQVKQDWLYDAFIGYFAEVVPPMYDSKPIWEITRLLAGKLGLGEFFPWDNLDDAFRNQLRGTGVELDELKEQGFVITDPAEYRKYEKWGGCNPPEGYGSSGKSRSGKFCFVNPVSDEKGLDPMPDYKAPDPEFAPDEEYPFVFGNFRFFQHEHCSTFNNYQLMKLKPTNPLWMNEDDAARLGLVEGDTVRLISPWGSCRAKLHPTPDISHGVLGAAGGYGHKRGLEADPKYPDMGGVNIPGALMPPNVTEPTGGTPLLKFIKCKIEKAS
ncbi:molybdopterin-dependent oxidoreductase [uncultured Pseudodesulfovibrio sp.]|uniref:molybdopterin-dependent oxidoreductase n=1 Tax=uncultured Pseudodesulfovibrio sp. TaxID=2035858 RepID=UPI0029C7D504|nr:molybdopterin-dependent oxidoreductase [uncultured Pseudodesulfovibrio sp.]